MKLRKFTLDDYEELVDMYYEFIKDVYSDRKIGYKYSFYKAVDEWIDENRDIVLAYKDETVCGFTCCHIDYFGGLTEPVYNGEFAYVKPEYRKGRASYLLYKNVAEFAKDLKLRVVTLSRVENGIDTMVQKHFNVEPKYIMMEEFGYGK